jgi:hypothetical protein
MPEFHHDNAMLINKRINKSKLSEPQYIDNKRVKEINVDINKLLNRIKINKRQEKKQKIIYFSTIVLSVTLACLAVSLLK